MKTKFLFISMLFIAILSLPAPDGGKEAMYSGISIGYGLNASQNIRTYLTGELGSINLQQTNSWLSKLFECDVPAKPSAIYGPSTFCRGSSNIFTAITVRGATSYTWVLPEGWTGSSDSTSITTYAGDAGGIITVTANNECGSSDPQHITVMVSASPPIPIITGDGNELNSSAKIGNQWYIGETPIEGATGTSYHISQNLNYRVCVTNNSSCTSCSEVYDFATTIAAEETESEEGLIFPNPSPGMFTIRCSTCKDFIIYNSKGELILSQKMQDEIMVDITWRPKGNYWVEFHGEDTTFTRKILLE